MRWGTAVMAVAIAGALAVAAARMPLETGDGGSVGGSVVTAPMDDGGTRYAMPLAGEVVAFFDDPAVPWGPGHRGVDIAGVEGAPVLAAGDGVVAYVGVVVDRPVVSIDHPDGIRTTYEPVAGSVEVGDAVGQAQVIGTLVADASHCAPRVCLHWGAKIGDDYIDPLSLLSDPVIRLYPVGAAVSVGGLGDRGLGVAGEPPGASAADVRARHQGRERRRTVPGGGRRVDQRRRIGAQLEQPRLADLVAVPGRRLGEGGDHRVPVHGLAVGEDHHAVLGHGVRVEGAGAAVAERAPPRVLQLEELVLRARGAHRIDGTPQARGWAWLNAARRRSELMWV